MHKDSPNTYHSIHHVKAKAAASFWLGGQTRLGSDCSQHVRGENETGTQSDSLESKHSEGRNTGKGELAFCIGQKRGARQMSQEREDPPLGGETREDIGGVKVA